MSLLRTGLRSLVGGVAGWLLLKVLQPGDLAFPRNKWEHAYYVFFDVLSRVLEGELEPNMEYQAFLDHYPISKYYTDPIHNKYCPGPKPPRVPRLMRQFDWQVRVHGIPEYQVWLDERRGSDPRTVLSGVDSVIDVILAARSWQSAREDRVLVLMGMAGLTWAALGENEEVRAAMVAKLGQLFARVYTVGNDAEHGFRTMPLGLVEHKVRRFAPGVPVAAIAAARLDEDAKPFTALAAFGTEMWDGDNMAGPLSNSMPDNVLNTSAAILEFGAIEYYRKISMSTGRRSHLAGQVPKAISRSVLKKWLRSPAARLAGIVVQSFSAQTWWAELSRFRFLLTGMGDEIQVNRQVEALLVLTVPITQRGPYRVANDLQQLGFPTVVIDEWTEVTPGNLSRWWQTLSPRLASFRANCMTTDAYWRMIVGEIESCH